MKTSTLPPPILVQHEIVTLAALTAASAAWTAVASPIVSTIPSDSCIVVLPYFLMSSIEKTSSCADGITLAHTSSPILPAASAPASTDDFTAPTSPRMIAVTYPPPTFRHKIDGRGLYHRIDGRKAAGVAPRFDESQCNFCHKTILSGKLYIIRK
jgi:hypothetical protein